MSEGPLTFRAVDAAQAPAWGPEDAKAWEVFLRTGAGQRLCAQANFYEQAVNRQADMRLERAENNTGFARGWREATQYFFGTLSADPRPQSGDDEQPSIGVAGLRERHTP